MLLLHAVRMEAAAMINALVFIVIHGLPYGLNEKAIEAVKKIRFKPAMKDGKPISVRGSIEFTFNL